MGDFIVSKDEKLLTAEVAEKGREGRREKQLGLLSELGLLYTYRFRKSFDWSLL
jgi:hypothetical protein